jgi:AcrR family transcriptional regulator
MTSTKEHILFTALKLILKKGYGNVTMSELVEASGMSKGAFYHYFNSKDQIYHNTLDKYFFSYMESFDLNYNSAKTFKENLFGLFIMFTELAKEIESLIGPENPMISYYQTILEASIRSNDVKIKMIRYYELYIDNLTQWITTAQNNREIREDLNPETMSKHICGLMEGIMIIYSFQTKEKNVEKYFNDIFYQFFELIKKQNFE